MSSYDSVNLKWLKRILNYFYRNTFNLFFIVVFHSFCSRYISSASSSNISSLDWLTATCTQDIAVPFDPRLCAKKTLRNSQKCLCWSVRLEVLAKNTSSEEKPGMEPIIPAVHGNLVLCAIGVHLSRKGSQIIIHKVTSEIHQGNL